jgi:uncharacterized protein YceK
VQIHHKSVLLLISVIYCTLAVGGCCEVSKLDMPYSQYQPTEASFTCLIASFFVGFDSTVCLTRPHL